MGPPLLGAKLFLLGGLVLGLAALVLPFRAAHSIDIYVHATYFVVDHVALLWISSTICWIYAALYYASVRVLHLSIKTLLTLIHFVTTTIALIGINSIYLWPVTGSQESFVDAFGGHNTAIRIASISFFLFLMSCLLFLILIVLRVVAKFRRATA